MTTPDPLLDQPADDCIEHVWCTTAWDLTPVGTFETKTCTRCRTEDLTAPFGLR